VRSGIGDRGKQRYYAAVDDGRSARIRAFVVQPTLYARLEQGQFVRATVTRHLRYVRGIAPLEPPNGKSR